MSRTQSGNTTEPDDRGPRSPARPPFVRRSLVALGSAAVLTVYAAGYAKTREAAARFADADRAARRPVPPVSTPATVEGDRPVTIAVASTAKDTPHVAPMAALTSAPTTQVVSTPAPARAPSPSDLLAGIASDTTTEHLEDTTVVAPTAPATTDSVAKDSVVAAPVWKDGEYYGWGTSRHGDIQAGVEIRGGKITAAWVQQCLTRYSCSWIAALPGQVVSRQSPETDYVSGATQSTNAFYYAVVEALSKAK